MRMAKPLFSWSGLYFGTRASQRLAARPETSQVAGGRGTESREITAPVAATMASLGAGFD